MPANQKVDPAGVERLKPKDRWAGSDGCTAVLVFHRHISNRAWLAQACCKSETWLRKVGRCLCPRRPAARLPFPISFPACAKVSTSLRAQVTKLSILESWTTHHSGMIRPQMLTRETRKAPSLEVGPLIPRVRPSVPATKPCTPGLGTQSILERASLAIHKIPSVGC